MLPKKNLVADALSRLHPLTVPAEPQLVPGVQDPQSVQWTGVRTSTSTWSLSRRWVSFTIMSGGMHVYGKELVDRMRKAGHDHSHIWEHIMWATDNWAPDVLEGLSWESFDDCKDQNY
jgi:hypothetical protein